jgi:hypothetical protein
MGGGGGGFFSSVNPKSLQDKIRETEKNVSDTFTEQELSGLLGNYLSDANKRDTRLITERLDEIKESIKDRLEEAVDTVYGGSVAKHTYVDGISDIDSLLILKGNKNESLSPEEFKRHVCDELKSKIKGADVKAGNIAITLRYKDGMEIQVIPALDNGKTIHVPAWDENKWSKINPKRFTDALSNYNQKNSNKLVPTIKLAKAINSTLPESLRLSGYHIESLAINAFKNYSGVCQPSRMLPHLFERISKDVLSPVTDSTGQSVHVDEYLGSTGSKKRQEISHVFERMSKRMHNATAAGSIRQWQSLFEDDNS